MKLEAILKHIDKLPVSDKAKLISILSGSSKEIKRASREQIFNDFCEKRFGTILRTGMILLDWKGNHWLITHDPQVRSGQSVASVDARDLDHPGTTNWFPKTYLKDMKLTNEKFTHAWAQKYFQKLLEVSDHRGWDVTNFISEYQQLTGKASSLITPAAAKYIMGYFLNTIKNNKGIPQGTAERILSLEPFVKQIPDLKVLIKSVKEGSAVNR